ncbi:MAG: FAD-dependent oxidoreductase [Alphaproteobacteria bacterium]|nr:FAD-dependent oxidoreductase [Alphaproteobacteria bacterium]MCB9698223.1 FAD-dependent oxidoreductase [Alphaproteobacteria bacterium]
MRITVIGAGVVGVASALELRARGHAVRLVEAGRVPRPEAASTDISKLVRPDYGADRWYRDLMLEARERWLAWNAVFERPLYHETGLLVLASRWEPGGFERDSHDALVDAGVPVDRFHPGETPIAAWRWAGEGYVDRLAGWAESGAVVAALAARAVAAGVALVEDAPTEVDEVTDADVVVVAAGTWTHHLLPELADRLVTVGQPVFHLRPPDPADWAPPRFLPFACDIATTGWYGFCANADGVVKIANHGAGVRIHPDGPREVPAEAEVALRSFLVDHLPSLADAPIVGRRLCPYSDSFDGDFLIDRHPDRPRVVVAAGGSGHAFKFAPVLGEAVADRVEGRGGDRWARFAWRTLGQRRTEAARKA